MCKSNLIVKSGEIFWLRKLSHTQSLVTTTAVKALTLANDGRYDTALELLWNRESEQEGEPFVKQAIAFYQCDHLGTPQELTNNEGQVAWSAQYKAWGRAKRSARRRAEPDCAIRFDFKVNILTKKQDSITTDTDIMTHKREDFYQRIQ